MSSNIVLILGAGPNIGAATAKYFTEKGYKTIVVSRNPSEEITKSADLAIKADFSNPSSIASIFASAKAKIGIPNVVIYNSYKGLINPDPFSFPLDEWIAGQNVNFISAYAAAQEAVAGFRHLAPSTLKTFAFTGNLQIHRAFPLLMHLGVSKNAAAHMMECGAMAYEKEGFRFYYVDERMEDGSAMKSALLGGQAHAEEFWKMATRPDQGPWEHTFVAGKGYVDFEGSTGKLPDLKALEEKAAAAKSSKMRAS
ncbi:hypothetical protein LSUE1_G002120 [Lachnellula suecica]|uniref:NAD(P)-binding protein n=1 Tax=Lachnellula suecica TaxID=602035 RepID=A0A8T9CDC6_9HELO|nr:hypothetical protein LSUE1_G002120 [Lachnellula suecica]